MKVNADLKLRRFCTLVCLICLLFTGCTVKFISDYDEPTDEAVTALHKKMETFFVGVEKGIASNDTEAIAYSAHENFYSEVKVDISVIELRAHSIPKNELTQKQISKLKELLSGLESLHTDEEGLGNSLIVMQSRNDFNTALAAILKLEIAKKRGVE